MVRVMASGVFDILHPGHIYYLEEAKKLGDELVVVVARDSTVRKCKHEPITNEKMRLAMVSALKPVDKAVLGYEGDVYRIVQELKPDIIALGYDQAWDEEKIRADLEKLGVKVKVVRLPEFAGDLSGTRRIIRKIIDWHTFQKKIEKVEK
ncbi:MAG: adenylyltransferase/cytidyltransferase family protein [Candidatus Thermoplasmatota archaeon]